MLVLRNIRISYPNLRRGSRQMCSKSSFNNDNTTKNIDEKELDTDAPIELPPEPDNCCMSGCENCVWKKYASDLTDLYSDSGEKARKIIMEKIKDPTMQVFLKMELEFLDKKK